MYYSLHVFATYLYPSVSYSVFWNYAERSETDLVGHYSAEPDKIHYSYSVEHGEMEQRS